MKTLAGVAAAAGIFVGSMGVASAIAEPVNFSEATSCNLTSVQSYGTRVCYDTSQGYFYIYSSATTLATSFPSNSGYAGGSYLPSPWNANPNLALAWVNAGGGVDDAFYDSVTDTIKSTFPNTGAYNYYSIISRQALYDTTQTVYVYGGNFDTIAWYLNTAGYELVFTY